MSNTIMSNSMKNNPMKTRVSIVIKAGLCVSVFALCACATITPSDLGDTLAQQSAAQIPDGWLLPLGAQSSQVNNWSALYDDPILADYLNQALVGNFDVLRARTNVERSRADLDRAITGLKPRFDGSASTSVSSVLSEIDNPFDSYGLGITGRWDPDIFGQTAVVIDGSRAALTVSEALAADTRQAVLAQTARAYIGAVEAELQVNLAKVNLDFLTESRRISEARYRLGDTAKGDFSFAEANYQSALASYENTLQSARAARRALSTVLGGFPEQDLRLASEILAPSRLPARDLPARVLERRPDIIAARAQIAGRVASLRGAELARLPSFDISGSLSGGSSISDLFDPGDYVARLGAGLSQVIFDSGAIDANTRAAEADLDGSVLNYEQRLRRAMAEISDAYDRLDTLQRNIVNLEASSEAANEALRLESIQFDLGESSLLDVLQVQTRVNNIDAGLIRTKAALIETLITANEAVAGFETL